MKVVFLLFSISQCQLASLIPRAFSTMVAQRSTRACKLSNMHIHLGPVSEISGPGDIRGQVRLARNIFEAASIRLRKFFEAEPARPRRFPSPPRENFAKFINNCIFFRAKAERIVKWIGPGKLWDRISQARHQIRLFQKLVGAYSFFDL